MPFRSIHAALALAAALAASTAVAAPPSARKEDIQRGRYLVQVGGCNDCHTPGYAAHNGNVDESLWLTGDTLGWKGPWGTTYATNLRLLAATMTREQWIRHTRTMEPRPPMPWFNLRAMTDRDLGALHAYLRHLGPAGQPAPAYLPPGKSPAGPVVQFPG